MKVKELIAELQEFDGDLEVGVYLNKTDQEPPRDFTINKGPFWNFGTSDEPYVQWVYFVPD